MSYFDKNFEEMSLNSSASYKKQDSCYKMPEKSCYAVSSDKYFMRGSQPSSMLSDNTVEDFIGKGAFAKAASCFKSPAREMVAVKITKKYSASETKEEEDILRKLKAFDLDSCNFVRWESSFTYISLKEFVSRRQTSSLLLKEIRPILHQVATALTVLKDLGIAHRDLKPDNIMLVDHVRQPLKIKVIDHGSAYHVSKAEGVSYSQSRWYRAPETILGLPCNKFVDMWSLGCIASELFLGFTLYPGSCEYEMIWNITQTQGQIPGHLLNAGLKTSRFYLRSWPNLWRLKKPHEYGFNPVSCVLSSLDDLKTFQQTLISHLSEADVMAGVADLENFVELVKQMLHFVPTERITPSQVLQHPFITMHHLMDFLDSSCHVQSCFGVMDICYPQRLSSDQEKAESKKEPPSGDQESTQEPISSDQVSTNTSYGAQSPQSLLPVSEVDQPALTHIKVPLKRKRVEVDVELNRNRSPISSSPARKKRRICEERSLLKRPYSQISVDSKSMSEICSPERKRRKKNTEEELAVRPSTSEGSSSTAIQLKPQKRKETASSLRSGTTQTERKKKEGQRATKIWIIGSSYIKRGEWAAYEKFGENFGLNAKVEWFGKGGMRWSDVLPRFYAALSTQSPPDILVVHAGDNDLGLISAQELSCIMRKELMQLHKEFPSMTIAYSCINERQVWRYGSPGWINNERKTVNTSMRKAVDCFGGVVIEHPQLRYYKNEVFGPDGVHYTEKGNELFMSSIQFSIRKILQKSSQRKQT